MKPSPEKLKLFKKISRYLIQASIVGYLIYQLLEIGVAKVWASLPTEPLFYILFVLIYFSLPLAEVLIYKLKWPITFKNALPVFIQKKVLNTDVVGYSGEIYLYLWAKKNIADPAKEVFIFIKDNNVISSISSTFITVGLLIFFVSKGYIDISEYIEGIDRLGWVFILIAVIIVSVIAYRYRKAIISLNLSDGIKIFSLHSSRILLINILQILQWSVARPDIALSVWFSFSAVQILSSRIPFLPSTDALFVSIALEMTPLVEIPQEAIVGMLAANLVLVRILNLVSYFISGYVKKQLPLDDEMTKSEYIANE